MSGNKMGAALTPPCFGSPAQSGTGASLGKSQYYFAAGALLCLTLVCMAGSPVQAQGLGHSLPSFAELVKRHRPAVVNISPVSPREGSRRGGRHLLGELFRESLGSGFLISRDGLILTNYHVVEHATKIVVRTGDRREFLARLVGKDPRTDVALLKIEGGGPWPFVRLGDSAQLEVGEWVIAIGNPYGLDQTVTAGIVSAKGRVLSGSPYDDYIQTDASMNPGNSGGPIFNTQGEVVGVATAISPSGQGIGFAIPINLVKKLLPQLIKAGRVTRGWLGVQIQDVSQETRKAWGLKDDRGAFVADVFAQGPAQVAGIIRGDVILEFNGQPVHRMHDLPLLVAEAVMGRPVTVLLIRKGKEKRIAVAIQALKEDAVPAPQQKEDE